MSRIIIVFSILLIIASACNPAKYCPKHGYLQVEGSDTSRYDSIVEKWHDSIIKVPADSSWFMALLACDSTGNVYMRQIEGYKAGIHSGIPQVSVKNNYIIVRTVINEFEVFVRWREKEVYQRLKTSQVYVKITNILTGWQWFQLWSGRIALIVIVLFVGIKYIYPLVRKMILKV